LAAVMTAVAGLACGAAAAVGQTDGGTARLLVDRDLKRTPVTLTSIDSRTITYVDAGGTIQHDATSRYVAIISAVAEAPMETAGSAATGMPRPAGPGAPTGARARRAAAAPSDEIKMPGGTRLFSPFDTNGARPWIELTDGQRLAGRPVNTPRKNGEKGADVVVWEHPQLGWLAIPLDNVARISVQGLEIDGRTAAPRAARPVGGGGSGDVIVLANGDRMEGFVSAVGATVTVEAAGENGGRATDLPLSRIAEIDFANPAREPSGPLIWLADGNVIGVTAMQAPREGQVRLRTALPSSAAGPGAGAGAAAKGRASLGAGKESEEHIFLLDEIKAVLLDPAAVKALAAIAPAEQKPVGERRWMEPLEIGDARTATLGAAEVRLPGPMRVEWELPDGASRLTMSAELPASMRTWGDCILIISERAAGQPERELVRERINGERPRVEINTALGAGVGSRRLAITLDPGAYGPIQDRIVLTGAMVGIQGKVAGRQN
jgi:hypothetical protein